MEERRTGSVAAGKPKKSGGFLAQGSIYAASGVISSLIGLVYRMPLTRIIGDEGNGYYAAAFNIYAIILLLSSYSLPLAVSKLISARVGAKNYRNAERILRASLLYATVVGGIGCAAIFFGADWLAGSLLRIPEAAYPLRALAPTVWIVSYLGVCRGYWQGQSTMVPTALSQIIEQILNAVVSVGAAYFLMKWAVAKGKEESMARAFGATGGTIGTGVGAASALLLFVVLFLLSGRHRARRVRLDVQHREESYEEITRLLVLTVVPAILSTAIYNVSGILDNALFGQAMYDLGRQSEIAKQYGVYTGKYKLLLNVPIMIANSLGSALVPALSRAVGAGQRKEVERNITLAIRFSMVVAIPAAVGLGVMADPLIPLLFGKSELAVHIMQLGCLSVVLYSLSTVSNAILQGTNHMQVPVMHAALSLGIHVLTLEVLLRIFELGIVGVVIADMVFALSMCILNAASLYSLLHYRQEIRRSFFLPAFCAALMGLVTAGAKMFLKRFTGRVVLYTLVPIFLAVAVYGALLLLTGAIRENELLRFPKGESLCRLARKLHLI